MGSKLENDIKIISQKPACSRFAYKNTLFLMILTVIIINNPTESINGNLFRSKLLF